MECLLSKSDTNNGWFERCELPDLLAGAMARLGLPGALVVGHRTHGNINGHKFHSSLWVVLVAALMVTKVSRGY